MTGNNWPWEENASSNSPSQDSEDISRSASPEKSSDYSHGIRGSDEFVTSYRNLERENEELRRSLNFDNQGFSSTNNAFLNSISGILNSSLFKIPAGTVGHCKPQDGVALQITDWEVWRKRFESWLSVNGVENSEKKQEFFNIMSGDQLYLALQTAPAFDGYSSKHYEQTVEQLNGVFRARANNFALKTEFRSTDQLR